MTIAVSVYGPAGASTMSGERIKQATDLSADFLIRTQNNTGLFDYDISFKTGRPTGKASIVRQAGTGFSLAEYLAATQAPHAREPVRKVLDALQKRSLIFRKNSQWIVGTGRSISKSRTGATALALLIELNYYRTTGSGRYEAARRAWLNGLLALRLGKRGFRRTPYSRVESPYFNGEAWLALATYQDTFRDPKIGEVLAELDDYLVSKYTKKPDIGFYHWGVMAAAVRYKNTRDLRLLKFIEDQTRAYLEDLRPKFKPTHNTCYALEGLVTASDVLNASWAGSAIVPALSQRIQAEAEKNLDFQLLDPAEVAEPPQRRRGKPFDPNEYVGLYYARSDKAYSRIDYTQHCLSAFLKMRPGERP